MQQENSCINKYYDVYLLYLRYELKKYSNNFHGKAYFYYHLLNPKTTSLIRDLTVAQNKYRKQFESSIVINNSEGSIWYSKMLMEDLVKLVNDSFD